MIWKEMRREFKVVAYTPCDRKPRLPGSIKMELSDRSLNAFDLSRMNVIDVDPYGDPWLAWMNLSPRIRQRTAIFLTHGQIQTGAGSQVARALCIANGIPEEWEVPRSAELAFLLGRRLLCKSLKWIRVLSSVVVQHRTVAYIGLLCEPKKT